MDADLKMLFSSAVGGSDVAARWSAIDQLMMLSKVRPDIVTDVTACVLMFMLLSDDENQSGSTEFYPHLQAAENSKSIPTGVIMDIERLREKIRTT
ncbi:MULTISPECIES: hypothetical protein [unclassified Yoonia]|uniref:hypothetical protein n=1 Tax=unclassified Yoonia TaxID=2629118 RepID=UPI002AFF25F3|nr:MULTISPECIES: hypothetical protein [unclassified Yoonia]